MKYSLARAKSGLGAVGFPQWFEVECSHSPCGSVGRRGGASQRKDWAWSRCVWGVLAGSAARSGRAGPVSQPPGSGRRWAERSSAIRESRVAGAAENPCPNTQTWLWDSALPAIPRWKLGAVLCLGKGSARVEGSPVLLPTQNIFNIRAGTCKLKSAAALEAVWE